MQEALRVLKQYWGYSAFRPAQEKVISAVLSGQDTLALLPTGGGKSLCYQVPGLALQTLTLVVSPLVALMQDQVHQLKSRGVAAASLVAGTGFRELEHIMTQCDYGHLKFLYVSPERLCSNYFLSRLERMPIGLIAVDEAHCISQWGYDFRPEYLRIGEVRRYYPNVPVIAVTATATEEVVNDIKARLNFNSNAFTYAASFERANLSFVVRNTEDLHGRLWHICHAVQGSGIVYVKNRKLTGEYAKFLKEKGIVSDAYHAGLPKEKRQQLQEEWLKGNIRVLVSTNAFGMGIDKGDVRFVVHVGSPDNPEAYYQEAGRAGRDGQKSWAVMLNNTVDLEDVQTLAARRFPDIETIRSIYKQLCNYAALPVGGGGGTHIPIDISAFTERTEQPLSVVLSVFRVLEQFEYIYVSEGVYLPSTLVFTAPDKKVYEFKVAHPQFQDLISSLSRMYGGIFEYPQKIHEKDIARRMKLTETEISILLRKMHKAGLVEYIEKTDQPMITFVSDRVEMRDLRIDQTLQNRLKAAWVTRYKWMQNYRHQDAVCRSILFRNYFGDQEAKPCGICDVCLSRKKSSNNIQINPKEWAMGLPEQGVALDDLERYLPRFSGTQLAEFLRDAQTLGYIFIDGPFILPVR